MLNNFFEKFCEQLDAEETKQKKTIEYIKTIIRSKLMMAITFNCFNGSSVENIIFYNFRWYAKISKRHVLVPRKFIAWKDLTLTINRKIIRISRNLTQHFTSGYIFKTSRKILETSRQMFQTTHPVIKTSRQIRGVGVISKFVWKLITTMKYNRQNFSNQTEFSNDFPIYILNIWKRDKVRSKHVLVRILSHQSKFID